MNCFDITTDGLQLMHGDCLERMKEIPDGSVDMVLTDPPYGTTACKWDTVIDLPAMWAQLWRIAKPNAAIVMTASQPFTSVMVTSCIGRFKHEWVWQKNCGSNFATLKHNPFKEHESVVVFSAKAPQYYPIKQERSESGKSRIKYDYNGRGGGDATGGKMKTDKACRGELRHPSSVQKFNREVGLHPTQKPVALMEYLIKTYTLGGETVLDFTMGSGTTGVACKNLSRQFIGIELDPTYYATAAGRILGAQHE